MIKKGDRVKFMSDTQTGTVVSIAGGIAQVCIEDGFEIPAMLSDLVAVDLDAEAAARRSIGEEAIRPGVGGVQPVAGKKPPRRREVPRYGKITLETTYEEEEESEGAVDLGALRATFYRNQVATENAALAVEVRRAAAEPSPVEQTAYELKLAFVPKRETVDGSVACPAESDLRLFLVNDSSYHLYYTVGQWNEQRTWTHLVAHGTLEDDTKQELMCFTREQLSRGPRLRVEVMLYKPGNQVPVGVEPYELEVNPLKFVRASTYRENDYFEEPSILFTIGSNQGGGEELLNDPEALVRKLAEQGVSVGRVRTENLHANRIDNLHDKSSSVAQDPRRVEPEIIDLHAEAIFDSVEGMTSGEIVQGQLARFELVLDLGLKQGRGGRMVFIHGVGSGKLKYEIQKLLTTKYKGLRFQDASFQEYGYGAILVFLR